MTLYNYQFFNILLHEIPQMENMLISQSKNINIVIAHNDWKTWVLVVFHPSSASVCLAINWEQKPQASTDGMFCSWLYEIL